MKIAWHKVNSYSLFFILFCSTLPLKAAGGDKRDIENLKKLAQEKGYLFHPQTGYYFLSRQTFTRGGVIENSITLNDIIFTEKTLKNFAKKLTPLTENYKIHLMPMGDFTEIAHILIKALEDDKELQTLIRNFKFKAKPFSIETFKKNKKPLVVIYLTAGKSNAQAALNKLYRVFKGIPGLNLTPRFNKRITDLLFIADGNGAHKQDNLVQQFKEAYGIDLYEEPERIYYNHAIAQKPQNYYHLQNPGEDADFLKVILEEQINRFKNPTPERQKKILTQPLRTVFIDYDIERDPIRFNVHEVPYNQGSLRNEFIQEFKSAYDQQLAQTLNSSLDQIKYETALQLYNDNAEFLNRIGEIRNRLSKYEQKYETFLDETSRDNFDKLLSGSPINKDHVYKRNDEDVITGLNQEVIFKYLINLVNSETEKVGIPPVTMSEDTQETECFEALEENITHLENTMFWNRLFWGKPKKERTKTALKKKFRSPWWIRWFGNQEQWAKDHPLPSPSEKLTNQEQKDFILDNWYEPSSPSFSQRIKTKLRLLKGK